MNILEPAKLSDREAVNALACQVHELHVVWQPQYYEHTDCLYGEDRFQKALDDGALYVARRENRVIGYVLISVFEMDHPGHVYSKTMRLEEICVAEGFRHAGIGRSMMEDVKALAKRAGCTDIRLTCAPQNKPGNGLYESLGMEVKTIQYRMEV